MRDLGPFYMLLLESSNLLVLVYCREFCRSLAYPEYSLIGYTYGQPL